MNSSIYAIRNDGVKFRELDLEIDDVIRHKPDGVPLDDVLDFHLKNVSLKDWWWTPRTEFITLSGGPNTPIPDICQWIDSTLVLSPKAHRLLGDLLKESGEFLPVIVDDETYHIFNCFVVGEAADDKCEYEYHGDMRLGITHLEFKDSASENLVFKTPVESCLTLFCNQRFKEAVESFGLEGVQFDRDLVVNYE